MKKLRSSVRVRGILLCLCAYMMFLSPGCSRTDQADFQRRYQTDPDFAQTYKPPDYPAWHDGMTLTQEEALEDFDSMWSTLWHNASFLQLLDENEEYTGITEEKLEKSILAARNELKVADDVKLDELYAALSDSIGDLMYYGHLSVMTPAFYELYCTTMLQYGRESPFIGRCGTLLDNQKSKDAYTLLRVMNDTAQSSASQSGDSDSAPEDHILIAEQQGVPYVRIDSFMCPNDEYLQSAVDRLTAFCASNADAHDLIIDIRRNGGGNDELWVNGLVKPLSSKSMEQTKQLLTLGGPLTRYLREEDVPEPDAPSSEKPSLPWLTEALSAKLPVAYEDHILYPRDSNSVGFTGKVWLLTDGFCFSSSDGFAAMCKSTGFATVVGTRTHGGGLASQPIAFPLPNSGLCVFFEDIVGLNEDGTCNAYIGTAPDIEVSGDALSHCLSLIQNPR